MLFVVLISFVAGLLTYFSSLVCANFVYSVKSIGCIKFFFFHYSRLLAVRERHILSRPLDRPLVHVYDHRHPHTDDVRSEGFVALNFI